MTPEQRTEWRDLIARVEAREDFRCGGWMTKLSQALDALDTAEARAERAEADAHRLLLRLVYAATWLVPEHRQNFANEEIVAHDEAVKQRS